VFGLSAIPLKQEPGRHRNMGAPQLVLLTYDEAADAVKQHLTTNCEVPYMSLRAELPQELRELPLDSLRGWLGATAYQGDEALIISLVLATLRLAQDLALAATESGASVPR
jgi:hypothetical protein